MNLPEIEERLQGVKHTSSGFTARCPAHEDQRNSLSVSRGDDGKLLLHCHAGCDTDSICGALGITVSDLFSDNGTERKTGLGKIVAVYPYRDEARTVLYEAVRFKPKDFRQRVPLADGSYSWKLNGVRRVPYRLPELLAFEGDGWIFIVEGEKDVHSLVDRGMVATCNVGGAGKWRPEYSEFLRGRNVAIIPDNDEPGRKHGQQVAQSLHGIAARVRVVSVPAGKDATDYFEAGHTADDLLRLVDTAQEWDPGQQTADRPAQSDDGLELVFRKMSEVEEKPLFYLWPGRYALGSLGILGGFPGVGKSYTLDDIAARVSRGKAWPDLPDEPQSAGTVILMCFEDDPERSIRSRLRKQGADMEKILIYDGIKKKSDNPDKVLQTFDVRIHLPMLERFIQQYPDMRLLIVDPITSALGDGDQNSNSEMRAAMTALSQFAKRTGIAVIVNTHFAKRTDNAALYRILGSVAFGAVARSVWIIHQDPKPEGWQEGDPEPLRKLLFEKQNDSGFKTGLSFDIDADGLHWREEPVFQTASEAMSGSSKNAERRQTAEQVILEVLDSGLEKHADDLADEVVEKGVSPRTFERARGQLKARKIIQCRKDGQGGWFWSLAKKGDENHAI